MGTLTITGGCSQLHHSPPVSSQEPIALLPDGFKFAPGENELVGHYLYHYIQGNLPPSRFYPLQQHDLYGDKEPWELWEELQIAGNSDPEPSSDVYLFTQLKTKSKNPTAGGRRNVSRKVGRSQGSWHAEDKKKDNEKPVKVGGGAGGEGQSWRVRRQRFLYENPKHGEENGKWILHEFSLSKGNTFFPTVVCRLKNNKSPTAEKLRKERLGRLGKKRKLDQLLESILHREEIEIDGPAAKRLQCYNSPQLVLKEEICNSDQEIVVPVVTEPSSIVPNQEETAAFEEENDDWMGNYAFTLEELLGEEDTESNNNNNSPAAEQAPEQIIGEIKDANANVNEEEQEQQNSESFFSRFDYSGQVWEEAGEFPLNCCTSRYSDLEGIFDNDAQMLMMIQQTPGMGNYDEQQPANQEKRLVRDGDEMTPFKRGYVDRVNPVEEFDLQQQEEEYSGFAGFLASDEELPPWSTPSLLLSEETEGYDFNNCTDLWDWDASLPCPCF